MPRGPYADELYRTARRYWASRVDMGDVTCHLCTMTIVGAFDLDHVRGEGGALHPAHPVCNRAEGGRHGQALAAGAKLERGAGSLTRAPRVPTRQSPSPPRNGPEPRL